MPQITASNHLKSNRKNLATNPGFWICWEKPPSYSTINGPILSFLSPAQENEMRGEYKGSIISAREASQAVKSKALELYFDLVAKVGTFPIKSNYTLRQSLARIGEASQWWYHPISFKDCENDPIFNLIICILTIQTEAEKCALKKLIFVGAPWDLVSVMKSAFEVNEVDTNRRHPEWGLWLKGFGSRIKYLFTSLFYLYYIRRFIKLRKNTFRAVFSSFWDWSVWWDNQANCLSDRYFKSLPKQLEQKGIDSLGWFAWFAPHFEPGKKKRPISEVLHSLAKCKNVVILQIFLSISNILKAISDFKPLLIFLKIRNQKDFKKIFQIDNLDLYPLFSKSLLYGFIDSSIPHCNLVALSTNRACSWYKPKVSLSFLEHFPYSRAYYEGIRRSKNKTICFAVQHASYSHEKTFLFLHPTIEFEGWPDGCAVPHPDYVCAMGELGKTFFLECGYPEERVLLTGSPRYDHVRSFTCNRFEDLKNLKPYEHSENIRLLMVCTLNVELELEMVEAVCIAAKDLHGIQLCIRNHPFVRISEHSGFSAFSEKIEVTDATLEEDLNRSDLILFTYSTVAEEALIKGKPVWQWRGATYNGSVFRDLDGAIPVFSSVSDLRESIGAFVQNPDSFSPTDEMRLHVLRNCFYLADGKAGDRIVEHISRFISSPPVSTDLSS